MIGLPNAGEIHVPRARNGDPNGPVNTCAGCGEALPPRERKWLKKLGSYDGSWRDEDNRHTVLDCLRILAARVGRS
ncbi:MAG: hypothetical protein PHS14_04925 [Elusimicrobia bacterium]|nr:hypothetical protein [Elusimicrobiota bacterium]